MRTIIRGPYLRPGAWVTLCTLLAALGGAPAARAQGGALPRVAVVQVTDASGSTVDNLAARAAVVLSTKLHETGRFELVSLADTQAAMTKLGLTPPLPATGRERQLVALATELKADFLVFAELSSTQVDAAQQLAGVTSRAWVFDRLAEGVLTECEQTAFNLQRTSNEAVLLDDALDQNAFAAIKQLGANLSIRGRVMMPPLEDTVRVTFGQPDSVRLGATLAVLRNGLLIARMVVQSSAPGYCEGVLTERLRPELSVNVNDEVVLARQGTGRLLAEDSDADPGKTDLRPDERRHRSSSTVWAVLGGLAAVALGVWAFSTSSNDREDARTPRLVAPTNGANLRADGLNKLLSPVDFVATSTLGTDSMTFQIATDREFRNLEISQTEESAQGGGGEGEEETRSQFVFSVNTAAPFLPPGTYFWRVLAASGRDVFRSGVFTFTITGGGPGGGGGFLRSPDTVTALSGDGSVEVQWTPVAGAAGYHVFRRVLTPRALAGARTRTFRPSAGGNAWVRGLENRRSVRTDRRGSPARLTRQAGSVAGFSLITEVEATSLSFSDTGVENGTEYQWVVLTKDVSGLTTPLGEAQAASFASSTPLSSTVPAVPANFSAIPGDGQVILTWSQSDESDVAGYQVFRATSANGNFVDITNNLVTDEGSPASQGLSAHRGDVSVTDRGLTNGVTLFYRIRAVQIQVVAGEVARGGLTSPLSAAVEATPSSAPPQELQVVQPPNGSTIDADRPQLAWRGVDGAPQYTVQISTDQAFPGAGLIQTTSTETELIYPAGLPELVAETTYFMRVGVFDEGLQQTRFGPTSSFTRGDVGRVTTTILTRLSGAEFNGARLTVDGADTGELTPAELILAPKAGGAPYTIEASFTDNDGNRSEGTASYRPGIDPATVEIELTGVGVAPVPPTGLKATGQTDRVVLRWNPDPNLLNGGPQPANVAATYSIRRRANTEEGQFTEIARVTGPTVRGEVEQLLFTDFNVQSGVRYFYRLIALSATEVESLPSVTTNGVAGVSVLQVLTPQENQTFDAKIQQGAKRWTSQIDFAWNPAVDATRYIFEVGSDPELNNLLENGNEIIGQSDAPKTTYTLGEDAPEGFIFAGPTVIIELYWRVTAVDAENRILNQTEARRFFVRTRALVAAPD